MEIKNISVGQINIFQSNSRLMKSKWKLEIADSRKAWLLVWTKMIIK